MEKAKKELVFTAYNAHVASCGQPPNIDTLAPKTYHGYFENMHGEQWVFIYEFDTERAILKGGDVQWEAEAQAKPDVTPYVMDTCERLWYAACWEAITPIAKYLREKKKDEAKSAHAKKRMGKKSVG